VSLGDAYRAMGDIAKGRTCWQRAYDSLAVMGFPEPAGARERLK
jgi:hypothetical protein